MANPEYVASQLGGVDPGIRKSLTDVFRYVLGNLRFGRPSQPRAENMQLYFVSGTTAAVANDEFSIAHGLATAPYLLIPVLDLQTVNAAIVPLTVTRAADASRIYLSSAEAGVTFTVLVEAAT